MGLDGVNGAGLERLWPLAGAQGDASLDDARLDGARRAAERGDAKETANQFETLFAVMLVRELRRSMPSGLFGEGAGADVYEGWFDEHLGGALAERDALGIAGMVKTSIGRAQAARDAAEQALAPAQPVPLALEPSGRKP